MPKSAWIHPDLAAHIAANDTEQISDLLADSVGRLELLQREAWARELGLDPACADLLHLPAVPLRDTWAEASDAIARMSA